MKTLRLASWPLHLALFAILMLTIAGLTACGRKGPVRPPLAALPAAPADLRIDQQGDDFLLSWQIPDRNRDGGPAEDLRGFRIDRLIYAAADGCPTCRPADQPVATIELNYPEPAVRLGERLYWRDAAVAPGTGHAYRIVPVTVGGHPGDSADIHRTWASPPPAPTALQAAIEEGRVQLSWTSAPLPDGQKLLGYNLYRRPASGTYPPVPLNVEPLREPHLVDAVGEGGREAVYRVTVVARSGDLLLESAPSAEIVAAPRRAGDTPLQ